MTMMRASFVLLVLLMTTPANAYTCQDVRGWVAQYGVTRVLVMAKLYGVNKEQMQQARACFRRRMTASN